jgi:hypothetical protein
MKNKYKVEIKNISTSGLFFFFIFLIIITLLSFCIIVGIIIRSRINMKYKNSIDHFEIIEENNVFNRAYFLYKDNSYFINMNREITLQKGIQQNMKLNNTTIIRVDKKHKGYTEFSIHNTLLGRRPPRGYPNLPGPEDPRAVQHLDDILIFYNDFYDNRVAMFMYKYNSNSDMQLKYLRSKKIEKNWSPFIYNNQIYCSYTLNPHVVLEVNLNNGICTKEYNNPMLGDDIIYGGTPAIYIKKYNVYLGISHSKIKHFTGFIFDYFCQAYIFQPNPPFAMLKISDKFRFFKRTEWSYLRDYNVEFPVGLYEKDDSLFVSLGYNDGKSYLLKIDTDVFFTNIF